VVAASVSANVLIAKSSLDAIDFMGNVR